MAKNRKDHRGRVLPPNVSQKSDLRYIYRKMINGKTYVLTDKDLNELKKKIVIKENELQNGIHSKNPRITLNEWFESWIEIYKGNLQLTTRELYNRYWNCYVKESDLGNMRLDQIKRIHIIEFYKDLLDNKELASSTVHTVHVMLYGMLQDASDDSLIRENPANRAFSKVSKREPKQREPLTVQQQERFIDFVKESNVYRVHLPMFAFLLGTGTRFGEMAGLTWNDIDLENGIVRIDHALHYTNIKGKMTFHITEPKTESGIREIPLVMELRKQLILRKEYDKATGITGNAKIDGYTDFVFHTAKGKPYTHASVNATIYRIVNAYNEQETEKASREHRKPELLPKFSAHILRHTFCTRFCEHESNIKVIQEIMGHKDIHTTMDIYSHVSRELAQTAMTELGTKIKIS